MNIEKYFETRKIIVDRALKKYLTPSKTYPEPLYEAINYSIFSGGKRLRPILFFATYEMLRQKNNQNILTPVLPAACALEMVHTASLIHDDLPSMDNSDMRRNNQSCHKKFGAATAILAGDALITKGFEVLTDISDPEKALKCVQALSFAVATRGMIGGQTVDVLATNVKTRINSLKYIHMKKTGSLLQASIELACILFDAEENVTISLITYALNLGLAYQIIDDILDEIGTIDILGKEPGEDERNSRATYSSIYGLDQSKKMAEKLLNDSYKLIKAMPSNEILVEYISLIRERLPI